MKTLVIALALVVASGLGSAVAAQAVDASTGDRDISRVRGDLYRVRVGQQYTVFLVTAEGIILADPLSGPTAMWLKDELAARFPDAPVRYVLLTHHHFDRAEGAGFFDDTAEVVGHDSFNKALSRARRSTPSFLADPALLIARDRNGDGIVTPEELYWRVNGVESSYRNRRRITLGGRSVELIHVESPHAPDMSVLYFPSERVVFGVDIPPVMFKPFVFASRRPRDTLAWTRIVSSLDFDTLLSGQGETMARTDLVALREYLDALMEGVVAGYDAGRTVAQIQASPLLAAYSGTSHHAARQSQIADVYRRVRLFKTEISGTALQKSAFRSPAFCAGYTACESDTSVPVGTIGVAMTIGHLGAVVELTSGGQSWSARTSRFYDDESVRRETRGAFLFRYGSSPARLSFALLGGFSTTVVDTRGMYHVREGVAPLAGRHPFQSRQMHGGVTGGIDVMARIGGGFGIVLPFRVTRTTEQFGDMPQRRFDVQTGVGFTMRVLRRAR